MKNQELAESKLRYRTVADFTSDWEFLIAPDKSLRYTSPSCLELTGYSAADCYRDPATHHQHWRGTPTSTPRHCLICWVTQGTLCFALYRRPVHPGEGLSGGRERGRHDLRQRWWHSRDIVDRLFAPYFSTKEKSKGSGIGLFMAKTIIEKSMGGRLSARNVDGGAEFRIEMQQRSSAVGVE